MTREEVQTVMHQLNPQGCYTNTTYLLDCGLDSLDLAAVLPLCERVYHVTIDDDAISWRGVETIQDFCDAIIKACA